MLGRTGTDPPPFPPSLLPPPSPSRKNQPLTRTVYRIPRRRHTSGETALLPLSLREQQITYPDRIQRVEFMYALSPPSPPINPPAPIPTRFLLTVLSLPGMISRGVLSAMSRFVRDFPSCYNFKWRGGGADAEIWEFLGASSRR